jgi:hypothetical protein
LQKRRSRERSYDDGSPFRYLLHRKGIFVSIILCICLTFLWWVGLLLETDQQRASLPGECVSFNPIPLTNDFSSMEHRWKRALDAMAHLRTARVPALGWGTVAQSNSDMILSIELPSKDKLSEFYSDLDLCYRNISTEIDNLLAVFSVTTLKVIRNTDKMSKALQRESRPKSFFRRKRNRQSDMDEKYKRWTGIMRDSWIAVSIANKALIQTICKSTKA